MLYLYKYIGGNMGKLYDNINALCAEKGIKPSKMCADIGISRGLVTDLKMGRKNGITAITAQKIASYFGVSVGYLIGEETEKTPIPNSEDERNVVRMVGRDGSYIIRRLTDEQYAAFKALLDQLPDADF